MRRLADFPVLLLLSSRMATRQDDGVTFTSEANLVIIDVSVQRQIGQGDPEPEEGRLHGARRWQAAAVSVFEFQKLDSTMTPVRLRSRR